MRKTLPFLLFLVFPFFSVHAQQRQDALAEYRNGRYERAVELCRLEIEANPNNLDAHVVICWSLIRMRLYEEGRLYALEGWNISRYDPRIVEILGEIYFFQGNNAESLRYLQDYINLAPQGSRIDTVYYYMGEIFIRQGKFRHADIALSTAVYYMPKNAGWWTRLGYARESAGDRREALNAYEQALALNSQLPDARRGLDRVRLALNPPQ
jgi:tetratricopeptide (TPR) repeat protein